MHWDATINLGNLITIVGFLVTLIGMHTANVKRLSKIEIQLDTMYAWFMKNVILKDGR